MDALTLLQQLRDAEQAYRVALQGIQQHGSELFKAVRNEHHLTQRQLAEVLHVDFTFISKIENGHMRPGKPVLERLGAFLLDQQKDENDTRSGSSTRT